MAIVSRVCTLQMASATGGTRTWSATAVTQDTANGSSVVINYAMATAGIAPPDAPNSDILVRVKNDAGTTIRTYNVTPGTASQALAAFFFTTDGTSGGASRHGTLFIDIQVTKTNGGPTATYDYETDGSPSTVITGGSVPQVDRGFIRGTTTATITASNISAGGGKTEPAVYQETVHHRAVLGSASYTSKQLTHVFSGTSKTTTSASGTGVTRDATFSGTSLTTGRVNEGFPAADATYTATLGTIPNPAISTGVPYTTISVTTDTLNVDPRLTAVHLFQLNDNSYGTPPLSKQETSTDRPSSDLGYFSTCFHHARGGVSSGVVTGGVNGLTIDIDLVSAVNGDTVSRTATTGTSGGETGWTAGFMQWSSSLPGGIWDKAVDITSPSDIDADSYLLNSTEEYTLVAAQSPNVTVVIDAGHSDGTANDRHLHLGDGFEVAAFAEFVKVGEEAILEVDAGTTPQVAIKRISGNRVNYWDGAAFQVANPDITFLSMSQPDGTYPALWTYTTTSDDDWGDVIVQVTLTINGVNYSNQTTREFVGKNKRHDDAIVPALLWIPTGNRDAHWSVGDPVILSFSLFDPEGGTIPDWDTDPEVAVLRLTAALGLEFLETDLETWTTFVDLDSSWLTTADGTLSIADTSTFDTGDLILVARGFVNDGEPFSDLKVVEVVAGGNSHSGYALDALDLALNGSISQK